MVLYPLACGQRLSVFHLVLAYLPLKKYVSFLLTVSEYIRILSIVNMKQLSKQKQALLLAALREGTPLNAVTRMFNVSIHTVLRVIRDTGEAFADYMDAEFRDLSCARIEMDEQWQYVGCHAGRMRKAHDRLRPARKTRGDFWLWACIDADTKLVFSHR